MSGAALARAAELMPRIDVRMRSAIESGGILIARIVAYPDLLSDVPDIELDHFFDPVHRELWKAIRDVQQSGPAIDDDSVIARISDYDREHGVAPGDGMAPRCLDRLRKFRSKVRLDDARKQVALHSAKLREFKTESNEEIAAADAADVPPSDPEITAGAGAGGEDFQRDDKGRIYHSQWNICLALRKLGVSVRYDMFGDRELIDGLPGFGPDLDDAGLNRMRMQIDRLGFRPNKEFFCDVIADQARERSYHPVREYLDGLRWDCVPRIDRWLSTYGGADDTNYTRSVARLILVAAVRRVRDPGAKFDEMPILEGTQGASKSTALATLCPHSDWFTDDLPLGADTKRQMEATAGKWIVEAGELKGMSKGDVHALKGYLSRTLDTARMAYGRKNRTARRQFVIIGTTNETADYLKDPTGNRRFWPVRIREFDIARLRSDRDQLWAEASASEASGESIRLDPQLYAVAAEVQEDRRAADSIEIQLEQAFGDISGKILTTEAWKILGIENRPLTSDEHSRFNTAMRSLGWERGQRRFAGAPKHCYVRGGVNGDDAWLTVTGSGMGALVDVSPSRKAPQ